jgi:hypothetical protein
MSIHPLFSGFKGFNVHQVAAALGFAVHVETARGDLPSALPAEHLERMFPGGDLTHFHYAGGWQASGVHCLLFAKPLTSLAAEWWRAGVVSSQIG